MSHDDPLPEGVTPEDIARYLIPPPSPGSNPAPLPDMRFKFTEDPPMVQCKICPDTEENHDHRQHEFVGPGEDAIVRKASQGDTPTHGLGFDPVLRVALVNKGILTQQDLRDAERLVISPDQMTQASGG